MQQQLQQKEPEQHQQEHQLQPPIFVIQLIYTKNKKKTQFLHTYYTNF